MNPVDEKIKKFDSAVIHVLWTSLISMLTAIVITMLYKGYLMQ